MLGGAASASDMVSRHNPRGKQRPVEVLRTMNLVAADVSPRTLSLMIEIGAD